MTVIASSNLNFGRGWRAHRRDIRRILKVADVVALQELRHPVRAVFAVVARVMQPMRERGTPGSEAIIVRRDSAVRVVRRGSRVASQRTFRQRIGRRRLVWTLLDLPDGATLTLVINYHRAPLRMQHSRIDEVQDARVRELVLWAKSEGWEWVVLGDMNQLKRADPASLQHVFKASWIGSRIDLAAVSPGLKVTDWWEDQDPRRNDNHPVLYLNIQEK